MFWLTPSVVQALASHQSLLEMQVLRPHQGLYWIWICILRTFSRWHVRTFQFEKQGGNLLLDVHRWPHLHNVICLPPPEAEALCCVLGLSALSSLSMTKHQSIEFFLSLRRACLRWCVFQVFGQFIQQLHFFKKPPIIHPSSKEKGISWEGVRDRQSSSPA